MDLIEQLETINNSIKSSMCEHQDVDYDDNNIATCLECGKDVTDYERGIETDAWVDDERGK